MIASVTTTTMAAAATPRPTHHARRRRPVIGTTGATASCVAGAGTCSRSISPAMRSHRSAGGGSQTTSAGRARSMRARSSATSSSRSSSSPIDVTSLQHAAQPQQRPAHVALHGTEGHLQAFGDRRLTEAGVERQLEDLARTGRQRGQRIGDQQPLDQVGRFGVDRRAALGVGLVAMRLRCAGLGAVGVVDAVAGDPEQPSRQAPERRVEPLTGPPGADERLLDAVGGEVAIAERADAERVDEGAVAVPDATSCPVVAVRPRPAPAWRRPPHLALARGHGTQRLGRPSEHRRGGETRAVVSSHGGSSRCSPPRDASDAETCDEAARCIRSSAIRRRSGDLPAVSQEHPDAHSLSRPARSARRIARRLRR